MAASIHIARGRTALASVTVADHDGNVVSFPVPDAAIVQIAATLLLCPATKAKRCSDTHALINRMLHDAAKRNAR